MRKLLLLPIIVVGVILTLPFVIWQQLQMTKPFRNYRKRHRKPPTPLTEADIAKAEQQIGFELPGDLREFYLSGRFRRSGRAPRPPTPSTAHRRTRWRAGRPA